MINSGNDSGNVVYLYHGTNCYRRMEINRLGEFIPGKGNLNFFCTNMFQAYNYARIACLRDLANTELNNPPNSMMLEPVVLKVRFGLLLWNQVDFVHLLFQSPDETRANIGVNGKIASSSIEAVLFCKHNRKILDYNEIDQSNYLNEIYKLRQLVTKKTKEEEILKVLYLLSQNISQKINRQQLPILKEVDHFQKLKRKWA